MASIRSLVPRASLSFHSRQLQHRLFAPSIRHASTTPPPKPRVLEKPERFNPPSHPSRLRSRPRQYPGPPLSEHERQAQKTRRYPHMMPAEGTFMHRFLTSRALHMWITLSILISLVLSIWFVDFVHNTVYTDLLPPNSMFFAHPFAFIGRYIEVYQMHIAYVSAETAERRRQKVEDVKKRSEYRKAHGLEQEGVLGGWTARSDAEVMGPALREGGGGGDDDGVDVQSPRAVVGLERTAVGDGEGNAREEGAYVDFEGRSQTVRKKWFGIW